MLGCVNQCKVRIQKKFRAPGIMPGARNLDGAYPDQEARLVPSRGMFRFMRPHSWIDDDKDPSALTHDQQQCGIILAD
jgi:hypothetical protein